MKIRAYLRLMVAFPGALILSAPLASPLWSQTGTADAPDKASEIVVTGKVESPPADHSQRRLGI
jgi:hypothetical protein